MSLDYPANTGRAPTLSPNSFSRPADQLGYCCRDLTGQKAWSGFHHASRQYSRELGGLVWLAEPGRGEGPCRPRWCCWPDPDDRPTETLLETCFRKGESISAADPPFGPGAWGLSATCPEGDPKPAFTSAFYDWTESISGRCGNALNLIEYKVRNTFIFDVNKDFHINGIVQADHFQWLMFGGCARPGSDASIRYIIWDDSEADDEFIAKAGLEKDGTPANPSFSVSLRNLSDGALWWRAGKSNGNIRGRIRAVDDSANFEDAMLWIAAGFARWHGS